MIKSNTALVTGCLLQAGEQKSLLVVSPTHRTSLSQTSNLVMGLAKTMPSMPGQISSRKEFPKAQRADVQWHLKKKPTV